MKTDWDKVTIEIRTRIRRNLWYAALSNLPQPQYPRYDSSAHQMVRGHPVCPLAYGDKMGMTGVEPAYLGLKVRCIAVMLHAQMSHIGVEPVSED